ncbi:N-acetyltransferase ESCO [Trypanosoma melophagium]|uniref:N-acetyltransferase ESCO n=1 Tax=Trypanosoma melophagium TaxID=715481 RepID=UPI00351A72D9|nr:N-acetyltransferase ESCO [Trypanosoma melophagium]
MALQQRSLFDFFPKKPLDTPSLAAAPKEEGIAPTPSPEESLQTPTDSKRHGGQKRQRPAVQTSLDFGQREVAAATTCGHCGMFFNAAIDADVRLHRRCCTGITARRSAVADTHATWLASTQLAKALVGLVRPQRGGAGRENGNNNNNNNNSISNSSSGGVFCTRLQQKSHSDEFVCYVMDCTRRGFAEDVVISRLVEALQFTDVVLSAASYTLVAVVHQRAERLICAVAGRPSTRQQEPLLLLQERREGDIPIRCRTKSSVTFCDVPYVWYQQETVLAATAAEWRSTQTAASLVSTRTAVQEFFNPPERGEGGQQKQKQKQQQLRTLVDTALHRALTTLGRHVTYGHALCPRSEFSYDCGVLYEDVLNRVDNVTMCSGAVSLYTHTDECDDGASESENELSIVSYSD